MIDGVKLPLLDYILDVLKFKGDNPCGFEK